MPKLNLIVTALLVLLSIGYLERAVSRYYEPPINFFFIIHVEDLTSGPYSQRIEALNSVLNLLSNYPHHPKITLLMNGDFIDRAFSEGDSTFLRNLELQGYELGAHAHNRIQIAPGNWVSVDSLTYRYGIPVYNDSVTHLIWQDVTEQVDRLTPNKHSICAWSFLCSTEASLAQENGYLVVPGNRSERCLDYTGVLMHHPMRYGDSNQLGYELQEDPEAPIIYLDHYAQIGNANAHGYNCTVQSLIQAVEVLFDEWSVAESTNQDSLDYYIWTFGFLTHLHLMSPYYLNQIEMMLDYLEANYIEHYTNNGNLIGRYATSWEIAQEFIEWESIHPGWSSFNYIHQYTNTLKINEIMYKPQGLLPADEWLEIYNPTNSAVDLFHWKVRGADMFTYWMIPEGAIEPGEYIVIANNGLNFFLNYGFYANYEVEGFSPAIDLVEVGNLEFHEVSDAVILVDTSASTPNVETNWVDVYSWGQCWAGGFCDSNTTRIGHTMARDSNSTDTDAVTDWQEDGRDSNYPTPGAKNVSYLTVLRNDINPPIFSFKSNFPNPSNSAVTIEYSLMSESYVVLKIYNIFGEEVASLMDEHQEAGEYSLKWQVGVETSSGIYICKITAVDDDSRSVFNSVSKIALMK